MLILFQLKNQWDYTRLTMVVVDILTQILVTLLTISLPYQFLQKNINLS